MKNKNNFKMNFIIFVSLCIYSVNAYSQNNELIVEFVNSKWNGKEVPIEGICNLCGGGGKSPELKITQIPDSANTIIVEFNDRDYSPLSKNGGHGSISVDCSNKKEIIVPSISEQTFDIPNNVKVEHRHKAPKGNQGAYLGPCSCGYGNSYFAFIKAIYRTQGKEDKLLITRILNLGTH